MKLELIINPTGKSDLPPLHCLAAYGGILVNWMLETPKDQTMRAYMFSRYCSDEDMAELPAGSFIDSEGFYRYRDAEGEEDEPLPPMIIVKRGTEEIRIYPYAFVAFLSGDDAPFFARLD